MPISIKNRKNSNIFRNTRNNKNNRIKHIYGGAPVSIQQFDLNFPRGIAIHNSGYVFVSCANNNDIKIFSPMPNYTHTYTIGTSGIHGNTNDTFYYPIGLAIDNDILYVADSYNYRIQVFRININQDGMINITHIPSQLNSPHSIGTGVLGNTNDTFNRPSEIAIDNNILYVADTRNHRIQMFQININNVDNTITAIHLPDLPGSPHSIGTGSRGKTNNTFYNPTGIAIDNNILYVCDSGNGRIQIFNITTNDDNTINALHLPRQTDSKHSIKSAFRDAIGIAIYNNILYFADTYNKRIMAFNITINHADNTITAEYLPAHTKESPANVHVFCRESPWERNSYIPIDIRNKIFYPYEIAIHDNKLYVADSRNNCIQIFNGDLTNPKTLQHYKSIPRPPPDLIMLNREIDVPANIRDTSCLLCGFHLCQRVIDNTTNVNGYIVYLHNLTHPNKYFYHYKCIYRYYTKINISNSPYKGPHSASTLYIDDIDDLLHLDNRIDALLGTGFY